MGTFWELNMGFLDRSIVNIQRILGDVSAAPQAIVDQAVVGIGGATGTALGLAGSLAGPTGPAGGFGFQGASGIDESNLQPAPIVNLRPQGPLDLSIAFGGFWSGGNGQFATRTIVERLNVITGAISVVSRRPGSPHLMNSDVQAAKKLFRQVAALNKRMPRKNVKQGKMSKLTDAAIDAATRNVAGGDCCPAPKC